MKKMIKLKNFKGENEEAIVSFKALMAKGWVVRWWKRKSNGEWKKEEKAMFDDAKNIVKFAEKKKEKGFIVQIIPLSSPLSFGYSGPIY